MKIKLKIEVSKLPAPLQKLAPIGRIALLQSHQHSIVIDLALFPRYLNITKHSKSQLTTI